MCIRDSVGGVGEPAFECRQAQLAFNKLSGKWINGYAGGVPDKWLEILAQVINEGRKSGYVGSVSYTHLGLICSETIRRDTDFLI